MTDVIGLWGEVAESMLRIDDWSPNSRLYFPELRRTLNKFSTQGRSPRKLRYLEGPTPGPGACMAREDYTCRLSLPPAMEGLGRAMAPAHVSDFSPHHTPACQPETAVVLELPPWLPPSQRSSLAHGAQPSPFTGSVFDLLP